MPFAFERHLENVLCRPRCIEFFAICLVYLFTDRHFSHLFTGMFSNSNPHFTLTFSLTDELPSSIHEGYSRSRLECATRCRDVDVCDNFRYEEDQLPHNCILLGSDQWRNGASPEIMKWRFEFHFMNYVMLSLCPNVKCAPKKEAVRLNGVTKDYLVKIYKKNAPSQNKFQGLFPEKETLFQKDTP